MRRLLWGWIGGSVLAAVALAAWAGWTYRLTTANHALSLAVEADRQRNFSDMANHVEQIQSLLGKGLVTGTTSQNMRYLGEAFHHATAATTNFTSLPLPAELSASVGKFLKQTGDFAQSIMRNEAAGRPMDDRSRAELTRLRQSSVDLSTQMQAISTKYNQGGFRWSPPMRFSWSALTRRQAGPVGKPPTAGKSPTQDQAPANMVPGGWEQVGSSMQRLPVMIYDGPFSDHLNQRTPAMQGAPVTQAEAQSRLGAQVPNATTYRVAQVTEVRGPLPGWAFRLAPLAGGNNAPYTTVAEVTRNGGYLMQFINSRAVGKAAIDLARAKVLGQEYLTAQGYTGMSATYGQVADNTATIAYAYRENGVLIYPDQIKLKIALDNGEILGVDAKQYLMSHHPRTIAPAKVTLDKAEELIRPELTVDRTQLAMIPDQAGSGEILTYEFLTRLGNDTYLVYVNAYTGQEEQILQQVQTDGGTFAL